MEYKLTTKTELFLADVDVEIYFEAIDDGGPRIRHIKNVHLLDDSGDGTDILSHVCNTKSVGESLNEIILDCVDEWEIA